MLTKEELNTSFGLKGIKEDVLDTHPGQKIFAAEMSEHFYSRKDGIKYGRVFIVAKDKEDALQKLNFWKTEAAKQDYTVRNEFIYHSDRFPTAENIVEVDMDSEENKLLFYYLESVDFWPDVLDNSVFIPHFDLESMNYFLLQANHTDVFGYTPGCITSIKTEIAEVEPGYGERE